MPSTEQVQVRTYPLAPTKLIPNSPHALIHYPGLLTSLIDGPSISPTAIFDLFASNGWQAQWLARYGPNQPAHYHSTTHECMAVLSGGRAHILFGVADSAPNREEDGGLATAQHDANAPAREPGGVLLAAELGDVFILPAGVAHKTHNPTPQTDEMVFHQPPDARDEPASRAFFARVPLQGEFMMMGAYPRGGEWDFKTGGEHDGRFDEVWSVAVPERDPVLGVSREGLRGLWARDDKARL